MPLPDDIIIWPNHGAGSACGKKLSKKLFDTLANQKKENYALQKMTKEEFVVVLITGIKTPPQYFLKMGALNRGQVESSSDIVKRGAVPLDASKFKELSEDSSYMILDTRT